mgnify:CR=1 FL=1
MNEEQQLAFDLVKSGKNVVITGSAGTGKSYLLKQIISYFTQEADQITGGVREMNANGFNNYH